MCMSCEMSLSEMEFHYQVDFRLDFADFSLCEHAGYPSRDERGTNMPIGTEKKKIKENLLKGGTAPNYVLV